MRIGRRILRPVKPWVCYGCLRSVSLPHGANGGTAVDDWHFLVILIYFLVLISHICKQKAVETSLLAHLKKAPR